MKLKLIVMFISLIASTYCYGNDYAHPQKDEIKLALKEMITHTVDPFLIIEIKGSEKYIQFYNENPGILLDLPEMALSASEIKKATRYFKVKGVPLEVGIAKDPNTMEEFEIRGWSKVYNPKDIDKVADIASGALFEVYGISSNTPLLFIKGWE